uniref:Uncharacterized protein n=1 Tax=Hyaloperonospora arabidopsidis (strain Emoy2) TaxID=559515 RepID=M4BNV3_HYAAE
MISGVHLVVWSKKHSARAAKKNTNRAQNQVKIPILTMYLSNLSQEMQVKTNSSGILMLTMRVAVVKLFEESWTLRRPTTAISLWT